MLGEIDEGKLNVAWFVGASYGPNDDQTSRFLSKGIWEIRNPKPAESALVRSMKPGDRIAIKSAYVRKHGLPFDNQGQPVSVFAIKAVGTVIENPQDGERVLIDWEPASKPREWYFYTFRGTIWRLVPEDWKSQNLIAFTFGGAAQNVDRFRNAPYWREKFGTDASRDKRFIWSRFYQSIADALLEYRHNRRALLEGIRAIAQRVDGLGYLGEDKYADGGSGVLRDICPFTVMGMFNRGITDANRKTIAGELATFLKVKEAVPKTFEGIPLLNNLKSWFFPFEAQRSADQIDVLWSVFAAALAYADEDNEDTCTAFAEAFDEANGRPLVAWNLTFGLYWIRPWSFVSLDKNSKDYIRKKLLIKVSRHGPKGRCNSADYLALMNVLERDFQEPSYPVHSYPELSLEAWRYIDPAVAADDDIDEDGAALQETAPATTAAVTYTVDQILDDGCFLPRPELLMLIERLREKKNLVLQGAPGTGKTWLAKRLAFALLGEKDESKVRPVQFHPTLAYEDFVRGWRPSGEGKLILANGVFMEVVEAAKKQPDKKFVVVIEEINRGNPAQIFGELLTLLEAGKRTPNEALELCYPDKDGNRSPVYIPENLYVIGTMNLADRSLALVDLALRRRFAFVGLEPKLGPAWLKWVVERCDMDSALALQIEQRFLELNQKITSDAKLGKHFQLGHSYVTPTSQLEKDATRKWFRQVVETEIGPLLEEYWFDAPEEAKKACERLLKAW